MQEVCDGGKQQGLTWNFQTYLLPHPRRLKQIAYGSKYCKILTIYLVESGVGFVYVGTIGIHSNKGASYFDSERSVYVRLLQ